MCTDIVHLQLIQYIPSTYHIIIHRYYQLMEEIVNFSPKQTKTYDLSACFISKEL